ncbi:GPW/gp25 family protein [Helicovermis profundi]|uniref:GPW/gp25 family protein n=1 Tax=Helicovermis profundi TaxID=3065157 RepID=A0AAU9E3R6_9FIRM|nr:GPW/gp25 family protein [Clostridia bacterium S502]
MDSSFLGTGWKFPIEVDSTTGRIKSSSFEEDIRESIFIILGTRKGERIMRPEFGSNINKYIFDIPDTTTITLITQEIKDSLQEWEPRITDVEVNIKTDEIENEKLLIDIRYKVRRTNNLFNLVYPFYISEGTKLE